MSAHPLYLKAAKGEHIAPKDIATLVRDSLKRAFPACKFSIKTKQGTGSVNVRWQDGPTGSAVETIAGAFETKSFDGMIDLAHSNSLWIYPDGSAHIAHDGGTGGSMGSAPEVIESPRRPDAVLLDNVASCFVFFQRSVTPRAYRRAIAEYRAQNWVGAENVNWDAIGVATSDYDGSGYLKGCPTVKIGGSCDWLDTVLNRMAYSYDLTEPEAGCEIENCAQCARNAEQAAPAAPAHIPCLCW